MIMKEFQGVILQGRVGDDIDDVAARAWLLSRADGVQVAVEFNGKALYTHVGESKEATIERWSVEVTGKTPAERKAAMEASAEEHHQATERMKERERAWESGKEPKPWEDWYARAGSQTPKTIGAFIEEVMSYDHDYNTVVMGVGACAVAGAWAANATANGGITGFQSSFVMWEFIQRWMSKKGPMQLMEFSRMLYPQNEDQFYNEMSRSTAEWLASEAKKKLEEVSASDMKGSWSERVVAHWKKIAAGELPFGWTVREP